MRLKPVFSFLIVFIALLLLSCKDDDSRTCVSCSSDQTPAFDLCREPNGNASVNGEDTGTDYDVYFEGLQVAGTTCGG